MRRRRQLAAEVNSLPRFHRRRQHRRTSGMDVVDSASTLPPEPYAAILYDGAELPSYTSEALEDGDATAIFGFREADRYHRRQQQRQQQTQRQQHFYSAFNQQQRQLWRQKQRQQQQYQQQQIRDEQQLNKQQERQQLQQQQRELELSAQAADLPPFALVLLALAGVALVAGVALALVSLLRAKARSGKRGCRNAFRYYCCCCWFCGASLCRRYVAKRSIDSSALTASDTKSGILTHVFMSANGCRDLKRKTFVQSDDRLPQIRISTLACNVDVPLPNDAQATDGMGNANVGATTAATPPRLLSALCHVNGVSRDDKSDKNVSIVDNALTRKRTSAASPCTIFSTPLASIARLSLSATSYETGKDCGNLTISEKKKNNNKNNDDNKDERESCAALESGARSPGAISRGRNAIDCLLKKFSFSVFPTGDANNNHSQNNSNSEHHYCSRNSRPCYYYNSNNSGADYLGASTSACADCALLYDKRASECACSARYITASTVRLSVASEQCFDSSRYYRYGSDAVVEYGSVGERLNRWSGGSVASSARSSAISLFSKGVRATNLSLSPDDAFFSNPQRRATCSFIEGLESRKRRVGSTICITSPSSKSNSAENNKKSFISNQKIKKRSYNNDNNRRKNSNSGVRTRVSACGCDAKRQLAFGYDYCCSTPRVATRPRATSLALLVGRASVDVPAPLHLRVFGFGDAAAGIHDDKTGQRSSSYYALPRSAAIHASGGGSNAVAAGATSADVGGGTVFSAPASGSLHMLSPADGTTYLSRINDASVFNFGERDYALNSVFDDDREFDNRSVMHYELGFYEKTFATNCFRGTLTFQLRYDFIHRVLMLHVMRAANLPSAEDPPDPYIKMYCLPERRHHCKTRIFKHSCDAAFNEMFSFDVPYSQLADRMLQFTVYNFDRFTRHGLIGNVIMRDLFEKSELYNWTEYTMQIVGSQEKNDFGDLLIYLAYSLQLKRLFVTVSKAYNLRPMDITGASDPYVKIEQIYQRRRIKMRKTSIKRANLNPVYHECLEFDVPPDQLEETNLLFQVMDWDRIGRDDLLGCCVLGRESTTRPGRQQWEQMCHAVLHSFASTPLYFYSKQKQHNERQEKTQDEEKQRNLLPLSQQQQVEVAEMASSSIPTSDYNNNGGLRTACSAIVLEATSGEDNVENVVENLAETQPNGHCVNGQGVTNGVPQPSEDVRVAADASGDALSQLKSPPSLCRGAKCSIIPPYISGQERMRARAIGTWHSILGEVPETFRNIPKAKK